MYRDYHVDGDSFGSMCPENWEEVAEFLNQAIDNALGDDPDYFDETTYNGLSREGDEVVSKLWDNYNDLPGAPKWIGID